MMDIEKNKNEEAKKKQNYITDEEVSSIIEEEVLKVAYAVGRTIGPSGSHALCGESGQVKFTKDGVSVMRTLSHSNPYRNYVIKALKEVCEKTNAQVGDGTTTSLVLACSIILEGLKRVRVGYSAKAITKGIELAYKSALDFVEQNSFEPVNDDIRKVAVISANNDKDLGDLIFRAVNKIDSKYGMVSVEESKSTETCLEISTGMKFDSGYLSHYFVNKEKNNSVALKDAVILITNGKIDKQELIFGFLEYLNMTQKAGIVICEDMDKQILSTLIINNYQKVVKVAVIKAPGFGEERTEVLEDIAAVTGGRVLKSGIPNSLDQFDQSCLGKAGSITILANETSIFEGGGSKEEVEKRCELLVEQMKEKDVSPEALQKRYSRLTGGVALIKIGGSTSFEVSEKQDRVNDAVCAVRSVLDDSNGIKTVCVGGGVVLLRAYKQLEEKSESIKESDVREGFCLFLKALCAPIRRIIQNTDNDSEVIIHQILQGKEFNIGFDALEEKICDLRAAGVLDSKSVILQELYVAKSLSALLLNTRIISIND